VLLKIKISSSVYPSTKIKDERGFNCLSKYLPEGKNIWSDCEFYVNEEVENPDFWFVIDDIEGEESCYIGRDRVIFLSAEVPFVTSYFEDDMFLDQFSKIYSPHAIYNHTNVAALPFLPTMIDATYGKSVFGYNEGYSYDDLLVQNEIKKTKTISVIASRKGSPQDLFSEFHQIRFNFANKLKEHFKDKIDLYGYGNRDAEVKSDAIYPYKYHIALENQATHNVVTEKLYDSYLGLAYPIYWGAPNITDYFSKDSITPINVFNFEEARLQVEKILDEDPYDKKLDALIKAKNKVLNEYAVMPRIAEITKNSKENSNKNFVVLKNRKSFKKKENKKTRKVKNIAKYGIPSIVIYELIKSLIW